MRVLLLGAGGMLGHDLLATAPREATVLPFNHNELDVTDHDAVASCVREARPAVIFNAAAYTAVDRAEAERDAAFRINAEAVGELGLIAREAGASVVHFSTDYVFDGTATEPYTETSPTAPVNAYGASKLAGEHALMDANSDSLIVRTQWLFGLHGRSFPRTMWERAAARLRTRVVDDQTGRPTYTRDLARAVWDLIQAGTRGTLHVTNDGQATWYNVAARVFDRLGATDLLTRCSTPEFPTAAPRPHYSVLHTGRAERALGRRLPSWFDAIDHFLDAVATAGAPFGA